MSKFKVGESVVVVKTRKESGVISGDYQKGDKATYIGDEEYRMFDGSIQVDLFTKCFGKIKCFQYEDLKQRIEGITAWNKEADDILMEIKTYHTISFGQDENGCAKHPSGEIVVTPKRNRDIEKVFRYSSQCEKLEAFKKAFLWLLDHSDIPKVDKEREVRIEKLEAKMEECQKELEELRG